MTTYHETLEDLRIKYAGCYAKHSSGNVVKLTDNFYFDDPDEEYEEELVEDKEVMVEAITHYLDKEGISKSRYDTYCLEELDLTPLNFGAINLEKSVILIHSRKGEGPSKYRKLPHPSSIEMFDPFKAEREYLELPSDFPIDNFSILNAWGNNSMLTPNEALEAVFNGDRLAAAFDPNYYFGISINGAGMFLYYNQSRVARVSQNKEILLRTPVHFLFEELTDFGLQVRLIK